MNDYQSILLSSISDSIEEMKNDIIKAWLPCIDELTQYSNSIAKDSLFEIAASVKNALDDALSIHQFAVTTIQASLDDSIKPICEALKQLNHDLNINSQEQLEIICDTLLSFESSLSKISIHSDYVEMPSELVPDNPSLAEDIKQNIQLKEDVKKETRKVSLPDAIIFICTLIQTLIAIISLLQAQLDTSQEQLIALQKQQISLQKEENEFIHRNNQLLQEQIDATYEQAKYLSTLLEQLQNTTESSYLYPEEFSETDSIPSNSDSKLQDADLDNELVVPEAPTVSDQSDNSESPSEPE